jgi:hypothetical protein
MEAKELSDEELGKRLAVDEEREKQHSRCETTVRDILIKGKLQIQFSAPRGE